MDLNQKAIPADNIGFVPMLKLANAKRKSQQRKIAIDTDGDGIADTYGYEVDENIEEETFNSSSIIDFIVVTIAVIAWFIFLFSL